MKLNINSKDKRRVVGSIRRTQLITTFGCGAIVDLPHDSVIVAGTDNWTNSENEEDIVHHENLEKFLKVKNFVLPKIEEKSMNPFSKSKDIPAFRFPNTLICTNCGKIAEYRHFRIGRRIQCTKCRSNHLVPSRFVVACENGHLDDFPYSWWVHKGKPEECSNPKNLELFYDKKSGGLGSIVVKCNTCNSYRNMEGSFSQKALSEYTCTGNRPWLGPEEHEECKNSMRTLQRGASNLHFGVTVSAISIPPWSVKVQELLGKKWSVLSDIVDDMELLERAIKKYEIAEKCNCTIEEVIKQAQMRKNFENSDENKSYEDIQEDEYRALTGEENNDPDFETQFAEVPDIVSYLIDRVVLVRKLKEVMALPGFKRVKPDFDINDLKSFTPLSKFPKDWLPAIELRGEGIFIKINEEKLKSWESNPEVIKRYSSIAERLGLSTQEGSPNPKTKFSNRYVLLHTLSHLIIRQLVLQCGYSSSSIKERIYTTLNYLEKPLDMAGILIYTATPDAEGSLGGLVREGKKENLDLILRSMLEDASWCSSDPLCIQSPGQGLDSLNLAACHSCTLLPETSCESRNCFLDRGALIGSMDNRNIGFFSELLAREE